MADSKAFWLSKTFWAGFVAVIFGILNYFDLLPSSLDEKQAVEFIMVVLGVITVHGRATASGPLSLRSGRVNKN